MDTTTHEGRVARLRRASGLSVLAALLVAASALSPSAVSADGNEAPDAPRAARAVSTGGAFTCVLLDDGTVKCFGRNDTGQTGRPGGDDIGDEVGEMGSALPAVELGTGRTATAISAGESHACALLDNGTAKCWGLGTAGRLGHGANTNLGDQPGEMGDALAAVDLGTGRTVRSISAGGAHTCVVLDDNSVKCWGLGASGRLGAGGGGTFGGQQGTMGDSLPAVDLGSGRTARAVSSGTFHTCALLDNGSVKCWGTGNRGQLGRGNTDNVGESESQMGDALAPIALGTGRTARAITTGEQHSCALLDNGSVKCWGWGARGQLGLGDNTDRGDEPGEMGDALPAVDLGTGRTAVAISAGGQHTCAVLDDATAKCWGSGLLGETGQGAASNLGDGPGEMGDALLPIALGAGRTALFVSADVAHTCAVLDDASLKCWGEIGNGRLGRVGVDDIGDEVGEMGDDLPAVDLAGSVWVDPPTVRRPDALVRVGNRAFVGNGIYNATGKKQSRAAAVKKGKKVVVTVRAQNDGNEPDALRVKGSRSTKKFTVTYRVGGKNVTKKVVRGTYRTPSLAPGTFRDIRVTISPTKKAAKRNTVMVSVTVRSRSDATATDTVKATVTRR